MQPERFFHMPPVPRTPLNIRAETETAVERAVNELRSEILSGLLHPGQRLSELDISHRLSASRLTVRLALEQLDRLGLAERRPGGGLRVTIPDADYLREVSVVALVLWKPALLETDFLSDAAVAERVSAALDSMLDTIAQGAPENGMAFTSAFFAIFTPILEMTRNRVWLQLHAALEIRTAIGVQGFTESIDTKGVSEWAKATKAAIAAGDKPALYARFEQLSDLSEEFARRV